MKEEVWIPTSPFLSGGSFPIHQPGLESWPTYFLGTRQWWALRNKYQAAMGSKFTLQEFHDRALDQGPLPVEYLEKILLPD